MRTRKRIVVDTNPLVSRSASARFPDRPFARPGQRHPDWFPKRTMNELADVLGRPKFDRYITLEDRQQFLRLLGRLAEIRPIVYPVHACRDPRVDKFLEVALNGKAELILTGDADLLTLHPWREIAILSPGSYLKGRRLLPGRQWPCGDGSPTRSGRAKLGSFRPDHASCRIAVSDLLRCGTGCITHQPSSASYGLTQTKTPSSATP